MKKFFTPIPLFAGIGVGISTGMIISIHWIMFMIIIISGVLLGALNCIENLLIIYRKDGIKYKIKIASGIEDKENNEKNHEKFLQLIFPTT
jgi:hypothetical protein